MFSLDFRWLDDLSDELEVGYILALCRHAARWRDVRLRLRPTMPVLGLLNGFAFVHKIESFPLLENFRLTIPETPHDRRSSWTPHLTQALASSPALQVLSLSNWDGIITSSTPLFCSSLRDFSLSLRYHITSYSLATLAHFLSRFINLASLTLYLDATSRLDGSISRETLELSHLQSLRLDTPDKLSMTCMLSHFRMPELTSLHVGLVGASQDTEMQDEHVVIFSRVLRDCASTLRLLDIRFDIAVTIEHLEAREAIAHLYALEHLVLHSQSYFPGITELLRSFSFDFFCGPQLEVKQNTILKSVYIDLVDGTTGNDFDDLEVETFLGAVVDMACSRRSLPRDARSVDGERLLAVFDFIPGPNFEELFRYGRPSRWAFVQDRLRELDELDFSGPLSVSVLHHIIYT